MNRRLRVYLADLSHPGMLWQIVPYAVGRLAAYAQQTLGDAIEVTLFKSPARLAERLTEQPPDVLGLSNYAWNHILSRSFARRAKALDPGLVIIGGGPHFPVEERLQRSFLEQHGAFDMYVDRDGELPFTDALRRLLGTELDVNRLRRSAEPIPGCHFLSEAGLVSGAPPARVRLDDELPSPYLTGLLDPFLQDGGLSPITQFKRGCPFSCTFCLEGLDYYGKVVKVSVERFRAELEYMARHRRGDPMFYLIDANFGMYTDDLEAAQAIADVQAQYGWPIDIEATTGKQQPQRVLQTVDLIPGAMRVSMTMQTTDTETLRNVKRVNIPHDTLKEAVARAKTHHQISHSELILGLPGETVEGHRRSIRDMIDVGVDRIVMYPLVLLPGTEMDATPDRERFDLQTVHQVLPHCHGVYELAGEQFSCVESWEGVMSNASMSFQEYISCRQFDLSVEIFYNDAYLQGPLAMARQQGISAFELVQACHERAVAESSELSGLYTRIEDAISTYHWSSKDEVESELADLEAYDRFKRESWGLSLGSLKAVALLYHAEALHKIVAHALRTLLFERKIESHLIHDYAAEVVRFSELRLSGLLEPERDCSAEFRFDLPRAEREGYAKGPRELLLPEPHRLRFVLDDEQKAQLGALRQEHSGRVSLALHIVYTPGVQTGSRLLRRLDVTSLPGVRAVQADDPTLSAGSASASGS